MIESGRAGNSTEWKWMACLSSQYWGGNHFPLSVWWHNDVEVQCFPSKHSPHNLREWFTGRLSNQTWYLPCQITKWDSEFLVGTLVKVSLSLTTKGRVAIIIIHGECASYHLSSWSIDLQYPRELGPMNSINCYVLPSRKQVASYVIILLGGIPQPLPGTVNTIPASCAITYSLVFRRHTTIGTAM